MNVCAKCGRNSNDYQVNFCSSYGDYLCSKHKNQWLRNGKFTVPKSCEICGVSNSDGHKIHWSKKANKFLCPKHRSQFDRLGKFLDITKRDRNEFVVHSDYAEILFRDHNGRICGSCKIDVEDVELCKPHKWMMTEPMGNTRYVKSIIDGKNTSLHRFILKARRGDLVDHINRNGLDNRKENLRKVTVSENCVNSTTRSSTGEKNIYYKGNRFQVQIIRNYSTVYTATFPSLECAILARDSFLKEYNEAHNRCV